MSLEIFILANSADPDAMPRSGPALFANLFVY